MIAADFIRHIDRCTNATLPGGRTRLRIGPAEIGWVTPAHAPEQPLPDAAAFESYVARLDARGAFREREERFDVRDEATGAVVATVDRGAVPLLGSIARGVHVNGLVRRPDGPHLWVGRRAAHKLLDPGKLDHLTAGGIASGHDAWFTLVKEAAEEASLPAALARQAVPAGSLHYAMEREGGLRRDLLFCFDLDVPAGFQPHPNDDEVVAFELWPIAKVVHSVAHTDDFKFNVALVLIDLFLRTGTIDPATHPGRAVAAALHPLRSPG